MDLMKCIEFRESKIVLRSLKEGSYNLYLEGDNNISIQVDKGKTLELNGKNIISEDEITTVEDI